MKKGIPRPKIEPPKVSDLDADDIDIIDPDNESPFEVKSFLSDLSGGSDTGDYSVIVYRIVSNSNKPGKRSRYFVYQWENECPTQNEIGENYGSGNYDIFVIWFDNKNVRHHKHRVVNIDSHFDKIKAEKDKREKPAAIPPPDNSGGQSAIMQGVFMVKALTEAIKPLFDSFRGSPAAAAAVSPPPDLIAKNLENMMDIQNKAMMKNFEMGFDMQRKFVENMGSNSNDTDTEDDGVMERLLNVVEKFMPLLRSLPEKSVGQVVETAKQDEQLKNILADPAQTKIFYQKLVAKHGEKEAAEIAGKFGIKPRGAMVPPNNKKIKVNA